MPELAEVEFIRKRWNPGIGQTVVRALLHPRAGVFKEAATPALIRERLAGAALLSSETAAKQMLFRFGGDGWLGIHLGMTGELSVRPPDHAPGRHDHLVLAQRDRCLVFTDPRMFGRVRFHAGAGAPGWWTDIAPAILSPVFTAEAVAAFLKRRARAPVKAVLLMQDRFPGIGNWMADEILWRAAIHPRRAAGSLDAAEIRALHRECRHVCRRALATIGETYADPPRSWLFPHRWEDGGRCPKTGAPLVREEIGGRTTCWSPGRQREP